MARQGRAHHDNHHHDSPHAGGSNFNSTNGEPQLHIYEITSIEPKTDIPPFKIHPCTGQISVRADGLLDFEKLDKCTVGLKVSSRVPTSMQIRYSSA